MARGLGGVITPLNLTRMASPRRLLFGELHVRSTYPRH